MRYVFYCSGRLIAHDLPDRVGSLLPGEVSPGTSQHCFHIFTLLHGIIGFIINPHIPLFIGIRVQFYFVQMDSIAFFFGSLAPVIFIENFASVQIVIVVISPDATDAVRKLIFPDVLKCTFHRPFDIVRPLP